jgi:hypothetical protein
MSFSASTSATLDEPAQQHAVFANDYHCHRDPRLVADRLKRCAQAWLNARRMRISREDLRRRVPVNSTDIAARADEGQIGRAAIIGRVRCLAF